MADERLEVRVGAALAAYGWQISAAESCTGGLVMHLLTNVPGSSQYVQGGLVTYSNAAKTALLGVPAPILETYGAVSEETAREMAQRVRALFGTPIALSVTGIAGPGGAVPPTGNQPGKPVGLTFIGVATAQQVRVERYVWAGSREENKLSSAYAALDLVLRVLHA